MSETQNNQESAVENTEIKVESPDNFWDNLFVLGLNVIMSHKGDDVIRRDIFNKLPEVILPRLEKLEIGIQNKILEGIFSENPSTFLNDDGWWQYIKRNLEYIETMTPENFFPSSGLYVLLNRIKDLREEVDWFQVMLKLSEVTIETGSRCSGFSTVLGWLIHSDVENLKNLLYRTETKSYPSNLKTELYTKAIDLGIFDVKIARRVRSDTSGTLSSDVLRYLFENRSLYSDDIFQDLVTQFSDTKHKWVARYIAMNMPMHLVPFLMGIKDDVALKILERRMEVSEDK